MPLEDLIFQLFEVACPKCLRRSEASFEALRHNDEMTCTGCGNVFLPNKDMRQIPQMIRVIEENFRKREEKAT